MHETINLMKNKKAFAYRCKKGYWKLKQSSFSEWWKLFECFDVLQSI